MQFSPGEHRIRIDRLDTDRPQLTVVPVAPGDSKQAETEEAAEVRAFPLQQVTVVFLAGQDCPVNHFNRDVRAMLSRQKELQRTTNNSYTIGVFVKEGDGMYDFAGHDMDAEGVRSSMNSIGKAGPGTTARCGFMKEQLPQLFPKTKEQSSLHRLIIVASHLSVRETYDETWKAMNADPNLHVDILVLEPSDSLSRGNKRWQEFMKKYPSVSVQFIPIKMTQTDYENPSRKYTDKDTIDLNTRVFDKLASLVKPVRARLDLRRGER
jgi:hypothetical protein